MPAPAQLWTLGLNYESSPLEVRERFALATDQIGAALAKVQQFAPELEEAILLSTCNRTELYGIGSKLAQQQALAWLAQLGNTPVEVMRPHLYLHEAQDCARHALRVAAGLNSMVLGEPQILGQVKEAVRTAKEAGSLGTLLHQLFERAFAVAKDIRTHTEIGSHSISMAAAATRLAASVFEDWQHTRVLLIGAGEMIELCAAHFSAKKPQRMALANRTLAAATRLAERFSSPQLTVEVHALAELPAHLHEFDVVVSSTASTLPIIGLGAVERALKLRKHRPIVMVDLAVPRDIETEVKQLSDIYLYTVDDLSSVVQTNLANRTAAIAQAEALIEVGVTNFLAWHRHRQSQVPKIQALSEQAQSWQTQEVERIKKQLFSQQGAPQPLLDKACEPVVEQALRTLARNLSNKFMHAAIVQLKENAKPTAAAPTQGDKAADHDTTYS